AGGGRETPVVKVVALGAAFNIALNFIFVPLWPYRAAATITLATEPLLAAACLGAAARLVPRVRWPSLLAVPLAASGVMAAVLAATGGGLVALLISGAAYLAIVVVLEVKVFGH